MVARRRSTGENVVLTAAHNVYDPPSILIGEKIVQPSRDPPVESDVFGSVIKAVGKFVRGSFF